jgi:hypothetical protein
LEKNSKNMSTCVILDMSKIDNRRMGKFAQPGRPGRTRLPVFSHFCKSDPWPAKKSIESMKKSRHISK